MTDPHDGTTGQVWPQSIFNDDDLKLVTEHRANNNVHCDACKAIPALLARLEAAERLAELKHFHESHGWCDCEECKAYEAWLRSCGKGEK
jgi:hypothetical protein